MNGPYVDALLALSRAKVDFVIVGVTGINFFARDASVAFVTQDLDVLLRPDPANLREAFRALKATGFRFEAGGEPFLDIDDDPILRNVIAMASNIVARALDDGRMDLMLALHDFPYALVSDEAVPFRFEDVTLRVAALERLLESKRRAGREKDLRFLEAFEARRKEFLSEPKPPKRRSLKRAPRPKPKK